MTGMHLARDLLEQAQTAPLYSTPTTPSQTILLHLSRHSQPFISLLIDSYTNNSVCDPIITPRQALCGLSRIVCSSFRASAHDDSLGDPFSPKHVNNDAFRLSPEAHCIRALVEGGFPLLPVLKEMPLPLLRDHLLIVRHLLLYESSSINQESSPATVSDVFNKYWKVIKVVVALLKEEASKPAPNGAKHSHYAQMDEVSVELLNIWNALLHMRPPLVLVSRIVTSPPFQQLLTGFRAPSSSSPSSSTLSDKTSTESQGIMAQDLRAVSVDALLVKMKEKVKGIASKALFTPSLLATSLHTASIPLHPTLASAIFLSLYSLSRMSQGEDRVNPQKSVSVIGQLQQLLFFTSLETNTLHQLIGLHSISALLSTLQHNLRLEKTGMVSPTVSASETRLVFLSLASFASTLLLSSDLSSSDYLVTQTCAWLLASIMVDAPVDVTATYLRMPQTRFLLSRLLHLRLLQTPLNRSSSLLLCAIIIAASRCSPGDIASVMVRWLTSARLSRKLLISLSRDDPFVAHICRVSLFHLIRCGLWNTIQARLSPAERLSEVASNLLHLDADSVRASAPTSSPADLFEMNGLLMFRSLLLPPLPTIITKRRETESMQILHLWLSNV